MQPARELNHRYPRRFLRSCWPLATRLAYADYLQQAGLNTCLYCPKADAFLRKPAAGLAAPAMATVA